MILKFFLDCTIACKYFFLANDSVSIHLDFRLSRSRQCIVCNKSEGICWLPLCDEKAIK